MFGRSDYICVYDTYDILSYVCGGGDSIEKVLQRHKNHVYPCLMLSQLKKKKMHGPTKD